ncbi:cupin-like domain-containing protein [Ruegeria sp. 2205SS24-7]|uniref:cupin-like domain-containing protein n=1 Tax=Ruegeria discodermiae TaxID=3064389 RepID=UPI0027413A8D|nr:cupin-like domain-containing protein [Ruegeria sp. 2205SS24-7]MDP5218845.1 cupin-like domain-containing protein [Ruegeria sp. 2205SS24-7]
MKVIGGLDRVECPSREEFEANYANLDKPVILTGLIDDWPASSKWDLDYLDQRVGHVGVSYKVSPTGSHPPLDDAGMIQAQREEATLGAYMDRVWSQVPEVERCKYCLSGDDVNVLEHWDRYHPDLKVLLEDFSLPPYFDPEKLETIGFWVSPQGVRSHLHYDSNGKHNLNAQISGEKQVWLFSPKQLSLLYPYLATELQPFSFSRVNMDAPDSDRFPDFGDADCYFDTLQAGELLFIPAYWFHSFKHIGAVNCNVNFWWEADRIPVSPTSVRSVFAYELLEYLVGSEPQRLVEEMAKLPPEVLKSWQGIERQIIVGNGVRSQEDHETA